MSKCSFIKPDKKPCNAFSIKDSEFCFNHNPATKEAKMLAVIKGGLNRRHYETYGKPIKLETVKDARILISEIIKGIWTGKIPANEPANSMGFLIRCFIDACEKEVLESKIEVLENRLPQTDIKKALNKIYGKSNIK